MADRDERLAELALALSDGAAVDWSAAESAAATDSERRQVRELRAIGRLSDTAPPGPPPAPPASWGPLQLLEHIGSGRFGDVYRAWDPRLAREVALKLLRRETPSEHGDAIEEGRLLARVRHPNVVTVFGAERVDGRVGVWMELVRGETLADALARGPLAWTDAVPIVADVARALSAVHDAGLFHRDVKAQNVVREADGRVVLMDFGTSSDTGSAAGVELAGTPLYLPPEVLEGAPATVSADIYSAGVLLFLLITGTYPVTGRSVTDVREGHRRGVAKEALAGLTEVPETIVQVLARALDPDPGRRFASAADLANALEVGGGRNEPLPPLARHARMTRGRWLALVAGLTLITVLGLLVRPFGGASMAVVCDDCGMLGAPSFTADGERLAFIDGTSFDAVLMDGRGRRTPLGLFLVTPTTPSPFPVWGPALSPDGSRIAIAVLRDDALELDVASTAAPSSLTTLVASEPPGVFPLDWSPDGNRILVFVPDDSGTGTGTFQWISSDTGATTPLKLRDEPGSMPAARVSPDGRWIAYSLPPAQRAGRAAAASPLQIMSAETGISHRVTTSDALETHPVWSTDGTRLLFVSNVTGDSALWSVPMLDGRPAGDPELLRSNLGVSVPVATTSSNRIVLFEHQAGIDQTRVTNIGADQPAAAAPLVGRKPAWSPDGRSLALVRPGPGDTATIAVVTVEDGSERVYRSPGLGDDRPLWYGDSRALLVRVQRDGVWHWSRLDLETRDVEPLVRNRGSPDVITHWGIRALAPDGQTLYFGTYADASRGAPVSYVAGVDLSTGVYRKVLTMPGTEETWPRTAGHLALAVSPDNTTLAMQIVDPATALATIWAVGVDGADLRRLCDPFPAPAILPGLAWVDDGQALMFAAPGSGLERNGVASFRVMRLDASGGTPELTGFETPGWTYTLAVSSDGTSVAYDEVPRAGDRQVVWSMAWPGER